jgi:hypothetical protein
MKERYENIVVIGSKPHSVNRRGHMKLQFQPFLVKNRNGLIFLIFVETFRLT